MKLLKFFFFSFYMIFIVSCGRLQYDNTVAYPLVTVSTSPSPAFEDVRSFVQLNDLIYSAAGSGGILVYRIVGDSMDPVLSLSLTNLYSEELEQVYIRTIEILQTDLVDVLIFAYDTLSGGGIGVAEISDQGTKPLGSLKTIPGVRIKNTITTYNPQGIYHILAASENIGVVSYDLSFQSNSYFEVPQIASLVDFVSLSDIERPVQNFLSLDAPGARKITNIGQITNIETLVQLALDNPTMFSSMISNIPFLSAEQQNQIQAVLAITNQPMVSDIIDIAQGIVGKDVVNQVIANPESLNSLLNNSALAGVLPQILDQSTANFEGEILENIQSNITPQMIQQAQDILENSSNETVSDITNLINNEEIQNILSLSSLQQLAQNSIGQDISINQDVSNVIKNETDTLFEESLLSNINLAGDIDTSLVHDANLNPFVNRREIGDAGLEIQRTVDALGRRFFVADNEELKNKVLALAEEDMEKLFATLFEQASSALYLMPLFESAGINIRELYQFWLQGDYYSIINGLDSTIIAEILRKLPRYQINTSLIIKSTNVVLPAINNMTADNNTLYIANGAKGFMIVDRLSNKVISEVQKPFSDVTTVIPYEVYGKHYYVVTDKLDGLVIYEKKKSRKVGKQVARIALVGEAFFVFPYDDILWVADGSNGILAIRFNKDHSLVVEAELYDKVGIAYFIGAARRREALVSYGADGLKRIRITNVLAEGINNLNMPTLTQEVVPEKQEDFIDRILLWGQNSAIAQFFRRIFLL